MIAFDYTTQAWQTGDAAKQIRLTQLNQELELLTSPRAADYLSFMGLKSSVEAEVTKCRAAIAATEASK
jgi:hypothetical protein